MGEYTGGVDRVMARLSDTAIDIVNALHTISECELIDAVQKLAEYEDAEAQGLLVRLPCKVGDMVFYVNSFYSRIIEKYVVTGFCFYDNGCQIRCCDSKGELSYFQTEFIGRTLFLTREEAEKALKEVEVD